MKFVGEGGGPQSVMGTRGSSGAMLSSVSATLISWTETVLVPGWTLVIWGARV